MVDRNRLVSFLDRYLDTKAIPDFSWNGLQVEGKPGVARVMFAVDAGELTFERAVKEEADFLVVHHGLLWKTTDPSLRGFHKRRIEILYRSGMSLYASHLPLDVHRDSGNNTGLLKVLGCRPLRRFCDYHGVKVGWVGAAKRAMTPSAAKAALEKALSTRCTLLDYGEDRIRTVAAVSGAGGMAAVAEAIAENADLFVAGEPVDAHHLVRDAGINVIYAGHHASETLGVKALSEVVNNRFRVFCTFVDIPTGL